MNLLKYRALCGLAMAVLTLSSCTTPSTTNTKRTAIEQLLLSQSAERSFNTADFSSLKNRKIHLSDTLVNSIDSQYLVALCRQKLLNEGARLVSKADADYFAELAVGAHGTQQSDHSFGLPSIPIPLPFYDTSAALPALNLYKVTEQESCTRMIFSVYDRFSGEQLFSTRTMNGAASFRIWQITLIQFTTGDIQTGNVDK